MTQQRKLFFASITILAVSSAMATSNSPSSSSSSSLTANMSDAADERPSNKRRMIHDAYEADESEKFRQKTVRISPNPSVLAMADEPSEEASSSPSIAHESSLAAGLIAPVPPAKQAGNIPVWFCCHPLFKTTFEHLNFADLTQARRVSKFFHEMAPQVVMPQGQQWINWCIKKFEKTKNIPESFKEIVAATGRCPNAMANLRNIVASYFEQVPEELRFWNLHARKPVIIAEKDSLRDELAIILDSIKTLKAEQQKARETVREQAPKLTVEKDLAALHAEQEKALAPLREQRQKIVDTLLPCLHALFPYALANEILSEIDVKPGLPEQLPLRFKSWDGMGPDIDVVAKKEKIIRRVTPCLAASCLPSIHASLFAQTGRIICLDQARCTALNHIEKRLRDKVEVHKFDPVKSLFTDMIDLTYYQTKVEQLREALGNVILKTRLIERKVVEMGLGTLESGYFNFINHRVNNYLAALRNQDPLQKKAITKHVKMLINLALLHTPYTELGLCRSLVATIIMTPWYSFMNEQKMDWTRAAHFAATVVALAGSTLKAQDLTNAAALHRNAASYKQAAQYYDQLFAQFKKDATLFDYINAATTSMAIAVIEPAARGYGKAAVELLASARELLPSIVSLSELKHCFKASNGIKFTSQHPMALGLMAKLQEFRSLIVARINELESSPPSSNPQPQN